MEKLAIDANDRDSRENSSPVGLQFVNQSQLTWILKLKMQSKVSKSVLGSIMGSEEIQSLADDYARKQKELLESSQEGKEFVLKMKLSSTHNMLQKVRY